MLVKESGNTVNDVIKFVRIKTMCNVILKENQKNQKGIIDIECDNIVVNNDETKDDNNDMNDD